LRARLRAVILSVESVYNLDRWHRSIEIYALMKSVTRRCGVRFTSGRSNSRTTPRAS
jgi:hypothetical protein